MTSEYSLKTEHVLIEDDLHAIINLKESGEIDGWSNSEYDLVVWNKEEDCVFALLKKIDEDYILSFTVPHFGQPTVQLDEVLRICKKNFDDMLDW